MENKHLSIMFELLGDHNFKVGVLEQSHRTFNFGINGRDFIDNEIKEEKFEEQIFMIGSRGNFSLTDFNKWGGFFVKGSYKLKDSKKQIVSKDILLQFSRLVDSYNKYFDKEEKALHKFQYKGKTIDIKYAYSFLSGNQSVFILKPDILLIDKEKDYFNKNLEVVSGVQKKQNLELFFSLNSNFQDYNQKEGVRSNGR